MDRRRSVARGTLILLRFDNRFWFQIRLMAFGDAFRNLVTAKSGFARFIFRDRIFDTASGLSASTPGVKPHTTIQKLIRETHGTLPFDFTSKPVGRHDRNLMMIHGTVMILSIMPMGIRFPAYRSNQSCQI